MKEKFLINVSGTYNLAKKALLENMLTASYTFSVLLLKEIKGINVPLDTELRSFLS
jgi:hypothetical protein